jgi:hypothetical protein
LSNKYLKLDVPVDYDFAVVGIICGFRNYRLCHEMNKCLGVKMERSDDIIIPAGPKGAHTLHACYKGYLEEDHGYFLVSNKDMKGTGFLIPEQRTFDYFLIIDPSCPKGDLSKCVSRIRDIDIVTGAFESDPTEYRSSEAFLIVLDT